MPTPEHTEQHFTASAVIRDIVIGVADGLTVPFALAAGLVGAAQASHIVVTAGLAEITAGAIAMGLGGYLAARTEAEHFAAERAREERETEEIPEIEAQEVAEIFRHYGLAEPTIKEVVQAIRSDRQRWVDFMMRFELGLDEPDAARAPRSALTIGLSYIAGGLVPLLPYMLFRSTHTALTCSIIVTLIALAIFGYVKGRYSTQHPVQSALQTLIIGTLAGGAAYFVALLF